MKHLFALGCLFILLACGSSVPSQDAIQTAIAQTQNAVRAATSTIPPGPTDSSTASATATNTFVPTRTPVPPQTLTARAVDQQNTATAAYATATQEAVIATMTGEVANRQATATQAYWEKIARQTEIASYVSVSSQEIATYPDKYQGQNIRVSGTIFNINSDTEFQIYLSGTSDAAYIVLRNPMSGVYKGDYLTIYGTGAGTNCGQNAFGATICQPLIIDAFFTR